MTCNGPAQQGHREQRTRASESKGVDGGQNGAKSGRLLKELSLTPTKSQKIAAAEPLKGKMNDGLAPPGPAAVRKHCGVDLGSCTTSTS